MTTADLQTSAAALGIRVTTARAGSQTYQCWADRVRLADRRAERGDAEGAAEMVAEANRYAGVA